MAYTAPTFKGDPSGGQTGSTFSGLRTDGNRVAMTGVLGNYIQTIDETASPVSSPVTVNTQTTLTVPVQAAQVTITPVTNPVRVTEDSQRTAYFTVPAGAVVTLDCSNMTKLYLETTGSTVVSFYFNMV